MRGATLTQQSRRQAINPPAITYEVGSQREDSPLEKFTKLYDLDVKAFERGGGQNIIKTSDTGSGMARAWLPTSRQARRATIQDLELLYIANDLLGKIRRQDLAELSDELFDPIKEFIKTYGADAVPVIDKAINNISDQQIKWKFLRLLGDYELRHLMSHTFQLLKQALYSNSAGERSAAVTAMAEIGDTAAVKELTTRLKVEENKFVKSALEAHLQTLKTDGPAAKKD